MLMTGELPDFIRCGRALCSDLAQAERREWWLANGLGGYAAGTVAGTLTRRYHGLLIAPVRPPLDRWLVFAKADATLVDGEREIPLFSNHWAGGVIHPPGQVHLESFRLEGRMPVWRYAIGNLVLEQRIWLEPGAHTSYVAWRLVTTPAGRDAQLRVRLLVNGRDHHSRTQMDQFQPVITAPDPALRRVQTPDFTLRLWAVGGVIVDGVSWFENFDLPIEHERGLAHRDHHLCLGEAVLPLRPGVWTGVIASLQDEVSLDFDAALRRFLGREAELLTQAEARAPELRRAPDWVRQLVLAADSFLFARPLPDLPEGESVIAGYPWFGDWGRDTMIALPGLTLATGRADIARRILLTFARFTDRGMLPNLFPAAGEPLAYNTADAALWYVEAWRAYVEASADIETLAQAFPILQEIIAWHVAGTRYGIGMDPNDGLLRAGEPGTQLTWMDAKVGDWVVTPRVGKPVEINALWYNALRSVAEFARQLGQSSAFYDDLADQARQGFRRFVKPDGEGLFDVLDGPDGDDARIRPEPDFRRQPASQPARSRGAAGGGAGVRSGTADFLRPALAGAAPRRVPALLSRRCPGTGRRLPSGAGVGLAAGPLRPGRIPDSRPRGGGASLAGADPRSSAGRWPGHGQRDFRRRPAASPARRAGAGLVGGLRAGSLAATGAIEGRALPVASGGGLNMKPCSG